MKTTHTKPSSRITALISGIFMVATLAIVLSFSGVFNISSLTAETRAQSTVQQNEEAEFTFNEAGAPPPPSRSVSINSSDSEVDTGETFTLSWDSENISTLESYGDWGPSSLPTNTAANTSRSESTSGTYTYGVVADEATNPITDEVTVSVIAPPRFNFDFEPITNVDIDGRPGATSSINLILESVNGYSGTIDVAITDVLDENDNSYGPNFEDENGDKLINIVLDESSVTLQGASNNQFAAVQASLSSGDTATIPISLQTMKPINEDAEFRVQIRMDDLSNTADDDPQFGEFTINADGFAPRTIEEF